MAVTTTYLVGDGKALPASAMGQSFVLKKTVDCAAVNVADNEIVKLCIVPAGTFIEKVICNVTTAEGAQLTFDVGDYKSASTEVASNGYGVAINGNSATTQFDQDATYVADGANHRGKLYLEESWIALTFKDAAATAVIDVFIIGWQCR